MMGLGRIFASIIEAGVVRLFGRRFRTESNLLAYSGHSLERMFGGGSGSRLMVSSATGTGINLLLSLERILGLISGGSLVNRLDLASLISGSRFRRMTQPSLLRNSLQSLVLT